MNRQPLVFMTDRALVSSDTFADEYPLRQTQALLVTLEEISAWAEQMRMALGETRVRALEAHFDWLDMVENLVEDTWSAIEDDEDQGVINCQLVADDPLVEEIEMVLDNCPSADDVIEGTRNKALGAALASLADFWVEQLRSNIVRMQSVVMGDGEVLAILKRQQRLAKLHF